MKKVIYVLFLTIVGFIFHHHLHLQSATIALFGAIMAMIVCKVNPKDALQKVDLDTLLFFIGLFILVGGLETTGVIQKAAEYSLNMVEGNIPLLTVMIVVLSGIPSSFVDNIPFTATMIPLVQNIQAILGYDIQHLWWALSLGACFGGNETIIGASPNVIIMSAANQNGQMVSFMKFFCICFPIMILSLLISCAYIYLRYLI